jgi:hypothetical protein
MATRQQDEMDRQILDALRVEFHLLLTDMRRLGKAMKQKSLGATSETERLRRIVRDFVRITQKGAEISKRREANEAKRQQLERAIVITGDFLQRQVSFCLSMLRRPFPTTLAAMADFLRSTWKASRGIEVGGVWHY